ncbi:siderophore-interacting protein [Marisediminicola sp. LYQ134]|uniref:siderophore-interacting protein n=1 Tax=unclassified Marisediminicola TaxID=2618316 RepID=UPI0039830A87
MSMTRSETTSTIATTVDFAVFPVTVKRLARLGENFVRVTFTGDALEHFLAPGDDQRVKLVLPLAETGLTTFPASAGTSWYTAWRSLPANEQCPLRTYTVRAHREAERELDIDFVVHGDTGPATRWVNRAREGDELLVVGPDARTLVQGIDPIGGIEFKPGTAKRVLLAGDETAAPAICRILETLPRDTRGQVFIEVASEKDVLPVAAPGRMTVTWLARDTRGTEHGVALNRAVRTWVSEMIVRPESDVADDITDIDVDREILWDVPAAPARGEVQHDLYAWIAGEAGCIKLLRRFLVQESGMHRDDVAFMGYWRRGRSEN